MKIVISEKGHIVLPIELRKRDGIERGQEFEIQRLGKGEYLLKRRRRLRNKGLVQLLIACPAKDWFQPMNRTETTGDISAAQFG
jgi:bifunctional DNA-binding transcriptional regulator/antitoxin component of YhaV-PrlF toxin-antitoxin module